MGVQNPGQSKPFMIMFVMFVAFASILGAVLGYVIWGSGATNYSLMSRSNEATRTVTVDHLSVTFPSVIVCKAESSTIDIVIINHLAYPSYVTLSLSLVRNGGVDTSTINALTGSPHAVTLAAYETATEQLTLNPSALGYAIFDLRVDGELTGSIALYVVS
jgi:hypothetical protein